MEGDERKSKWVTEVVIKGDESGAGDGCCGEEQMAAGGVVMAAVHGRPAHAGADPLSLLLCCPPISHIISKYSSKHGMEEGERKAGCATGSRSLCAGCCQTYWVRNHAEMR